MSYSSIVRSYLPRLADKELKRGLDAFGAVLIEGPKWCGKTTTAEQAAKSVLYLQDDDMKEQYEQMLRVKPSSLLEGKKPRLIDEWQMAPKLWDSVRFSIDRQSENGMYILTGSTSVDNSLIEHSGAGRIKRMKMGTMSLFESGDSTAEVKLSDMFEGRDISGYSEVSVEKMAELLVRGGWPKTIGEDVTTAYEHMDGYCRTILESDISTVDRVNRDSTRMAKIMRSLSRNISTQAPDTTIAADLNEKESDKTHINTVRDYVNALRKLHIVDDLQAWNPKLRSKAAVRTSDTRHFCDPAIAAYFLGASPRNLMNDLRTYGCLFESLVVRDLRAYVKGIGGDVYHYRDSDGLEADAVLHLRDGRWGAAEVKLGAGMIDEAAENLKKLENKVDSPDSPSFLAVITCTNYAFRRDDGVYVVPICCLRD